MRKAIRRLPLENVRNCRDLGGYAAGLEPLSGRQMRRPQASIKQGKVTRWGRFLRAGNMSSATENDLLFLRDYGLKHVIDLRTNSDVDLSNTVMKRAEGIEFHQVNLKGQEGAVKCEQCVHEPETYEKLTNLYRLYLYNRNGMRDVFSVFLEYPKDQIAFHCGIGKDRTGIVALLVLGLSGVELRDILTDYQQSKIYLRTDLADDQDYGYSEQILNASPINMEFAYGIVMEEFGGFMEYFRGLGFSAVDYQLFLESFVV